MLQSSPIIVSKETRRSMSGLAYLQGIVEGTFPQAPMSLHLNYRLAEVDKGRAVFRGTPRREFYNPIGTVHGGYFATILDSSMGSAVQSTLEAGFGYTTLEFKTHLVRAITEDTGEVQAEGRVVHAGSKVATAEGRLTDASGKLLAHATATCLIMQI